MIGNPSGRTQDLCRRKPKIIIGFKVQFMRSLYQVQSHIKKAKTVSWESIGKEPYYHPSRNLEEQF